VINFTVCGWLDEDLYDALMKDWPRRAWYEFWVVYFLLLVLAVLGVLLWNFHKDFRKAAAVANPAKVELLEKALV
jgi:hypothetical protein